MIVILIDVPAKQHPHDKEALTGGQFVLGQDQPRQRVQIRNTNVNPPTLLKDPVPFLESGCQLTGVVEVLTEQ